MKPVKVKGEELLFRLDVRGATVQEGVASELPYPFKIGRKDSCFWRVGKDERSVSAEHAEIYLKRGVPHIRDIGSRNGLYVMGSRVAEQRLADGVQISMGDCRLIVEKCRFAKSSRALPFHRLECLNGPDAGTFIELRQASSVIGSGIEDGILCADILVSKRHAEVLRKPDDTCWIKDLGSRNGTTVNKLPLKEGVERMLRDQDVIAVADREFRFWDRTIEHMRGHLGLKLAVALVTAAACGTLYFVWQTVSPSAKSILRRAQASEAAGRFDEAEAILETARTARGCEYYIDEIARKKRELEIWRSTIKTWSTVREAAAARAWISASKELGALVNSSLEKWGWNTTTAQTEKKKARTLKVVLDVFLEARGALEGNITEAERGDIRSAMAKRLAAMEAALANPAWTDDVPSGKLREDMEDQCAAYRGILSDLDGVNRIVDGATGVAGGQPRLRDVFAATADLKERIKGLEKLMEGARRREEDRRALAEKVGRRFVSSSVVKDRCERFVPPFEKFVAARDVMEANVRRILAGRYGSLQTELPLPSEHQCTLHPHFGELKRALTAANVFLCGLCKDTLRDQLGRLSALGVVSNTPPKCFAVLLDERTMSKVLACDSLAGVRPKAGRVEPVGEYDRVLGLETFADFLRDIDGERQIRAPEGVPRPEPLIVKAVSVCRQIGRFKMYLADPDAEFLSTYESQEGNCLRDRANVVVNLDEKRMLLVDMLWNDESPSLRARIIARGVAIALDLEGNLGESAPLELKKDIQTLGRQVAERKRALDADPDHVETLRPAILAIGLPGLHGINALWDQQSRKGGAK